MTFFAADQTVFFVDDDDVLRQANMQSLELAGIRVQPFAEGQSALELIGTEFAGVLVTDIRMPGLDGLELFARVRAIDPQIPVILITGHADVPMAINALKDGAFDFLTKPFSADHLVAAIGKALETRRLVIENRQLRAAADDTGESPLIGDSASMTRVRDTIVQVARADFDVLVEGETGTGKELAAVLLHAKGPRRGRPFIAVNCGGLPEALAETELFGQEEVLRQARVGREGLIEASSGGTLFLDEIDSAPLAIQTRLLRVLEEREVLPVGANRPRPVNLHVVAASKIDLQAAVRDGTFREDLYYRLSVVRLHMPPLRDRRVDIPQLFAYFVAEASGKIGATTFKMTDGMRRRLLEHDWPGNVRELRNFAFNAVLNLPNDGPDRDVPAIPLADRVAQFESSIIRDTISAAKGDMQRVVAQLGVPRKTLYDKLLRYGIEPRLYRAGNRRDSTKANTPLGKGSE